MKGEEDGKEGEDDEVGRGVHVPVVRLKFDEVVEASFSGGFVGL